MRFLECRAVLVFAVLPLAVALAACSQPPPPATPAFRAISQVEHGKWLVIGGGCHDCHTPKKLGPNGPEPDMSLMLSGHQENDKVEAPFKGPKSQWTTHTNDNLTAWSGPWGVSFAANLTPDENTGLGIWTEDMFVKALKLGKHMGASRQILPPMPWNYYGQLPEEDLEAMFVYLKSIPAIRNKVPVPLDPSGKPIEEP